MDIIRLLILKRADMNLKNMGGKTPESYIPSIEHNPKFLPIKEAIEKATLEKLNIDRDFETGKQLALIQKAMQEQIGLPVEALSHSSFPNIAYAYWSFRAIDPTHDIAEAERKQVEAAYSNSRIEL